MDERTLKRLAVIVALSIAVILLAKWGLTKTYSALNEAAVAKKQAAKPATQQAPALPETLSEDAGALEAPAVQGVDGEVEEEGVGDAPVEPGAAELASEPQPAASSGDATE